MKRSGLSKTVPQLLLPHKNMVSAEENFKIIFEG